MLKGTDFEIPKLPEFQRVGSGFSQSMTVDRNKEFLENYLLNIKKVNITNILINSAIFKKERKQSVSVKSFSNFRLQVERRETSI